MTYRSNAIPPVDPESSRPKPTHWQRFKVWFGCFINLTDHRWFRALCGGTWVHAAWYYADAIRNENYYKQYGSAVGFFPQIDYPTTLYPFQDKSKRKSKRQLILCNWLPLLRLEDGREYLHYSHGGAYLWIIVDTAKERRQYHVTAPKGKQHKLAGGGVMAPGTIEKYAYPLKITEACQFEPSLTALLTDWPDYDHLKDLGIVRKIA